MNHKLMINFIVLIVRLRYLEHGMCKKKKEAVKVKVGYTLPVNAM